MEHNAGYNAVKNWKLKWTKENKIDDIELDTTLFIDSTFADSTAITESTPKENIVAEGLLDGVVDDCHQRDQRVERDEQHNR